MRFNSHEDTDKSVKKRLSSIGGQEIINLYDGGRLGIVADVDLLIDDETGSIQALLIPEPKGFFSFFSERNFVEVPWDAIRKIGQDTLIVEIENPSERKR